MTMNGKRWCEFAGATKVKAHWSKPIQQQHRLQFSKN
jgi:hypothetical protein